MDYNGEVLERVVMPDVNDAKYMVVAMDVVVDKSRGEGESNAHVLVGTKKNQMLVVNFDTGEVIHEMHAFRGEVWAMAIHPHEDVVVAAGHGRDMGVQDIVTKKQLPGKRAMVPQAPHSMGFSPDGKMLA